MHDYCWWCWKAVSVPPVFNRKFGSLFCSKQCHAQEQYFRAYYLDDNYQPHGR